MLECKELLSIFKKYHYSTEEVTNVLKTVIKQCERWTDNEPENYSTNRLRNMESMRMRYRRLQNHNEIY